MTEPNKITRRRFLRLGLYALAPYGLALGDGFFIERQWLSIKHLVLSDTPTCRIAHFTDVHHKGDIAYFNKVIATINSLQPDIVCFTGDLIEKASYLEEAIRCLEGIQAPLYGIPGNHDDWSGISYDSLKTCFEATGGAWLLDQEVLAADGKVAITCSAGQTFRAPSPVQKGKQREEAAVKRILLHHYPASADTIEQQFDLILAGHSHGGQVRLPFYGAITVPYGVEKYEKGLFQTQAGPLFVNAGIGYWALPVRILCRPEIALIEI
ncbi:MAG: metallophosphoesterase [Candidatus Electrothrix aestuarii]|uniref:Metallophosphoesterase n=1 Tax=Candidatus Electrothrix aestuarii TaxID=3062594 RepID=A0AAU8LTP6_9BACT|nr:metallophosphoesterase [Candidatus Electrothrix aestuarii]